MKLILGFVIPAIICLATSRDVRADESLRGRVVDVGSTTSAGIPGVAVMVRGLHGLPIQTAVTDSDGDYEIKLPSAVHFPIVAEFSKVNYADNPATRTISQIKSTQEPVLLASCTNEADYYKQIATNILAENNKDLRSSKLGVVAALPSTQNSIVTESLAARADQGLMDQLASATQTHTILATLRQNLSDDKFSNVLAKSNFKEGKVEVSGVVNSESDKIQLRDITNQIKQADLIENKIQVLSVQKQLVLQQKMAY